MTRASAGTATSLPIALMRPASIRIVAFSMSSPLTVIARPTLTATISPAEATWTVDVSAVRTTSVHGVFMGRLEEGNLELMWLGGGS